MTPERPTFQDRNLRLPLSRPPSPPEQKKPVMRLIVPLQGIVQGRGGLILGTLIPCTLVYFLQHYLKRNHNRGDDNEDDNKPPGASSSLSRSSSVAADLHRSSSRSQLLSPGRSGSMEPARLSSRARGIAGPSRSLYYVGLERTSQDPYNEMSNPGGIIQLGLAESRLSLDLIENWLKKNMPSAILGGSDADIQGLTTYQPMDGMMSLKVAMADFMSLIMGGGVSFNPNQLVLTCGATPAIETLCFCLADHGNGFLVPAPYYPGFDRDIVRVGVELIPVYSLSSDYFNLSVTDLEETYNQARRRGVKICGVLFSNPSNPVGNLLSRETLSSLLDFAREKNIHIISDEIFAGSIFRTIEEEEKFVSMAEIVDPYGPDKNKVHILYDLSTDLSLPGFRVGAIYSFSEKVLSAAKKLARFNSISVPTQQLLVPMLSDRRFVEEYIGINRERLRLMYDLFVSGMKEIGVGCAKSTQGGLFCWVDMSGLIDPYNRIGEINLWNKILDVAKVNMTPGSACHNIQPGWFRCCFATLSENDIPVLIDRLRRVVETCKPSGPQVKHRVLRLCD